MLKFKKAIGTLIYSIGLTVLIALIPIAVELAVDNFQYFFGAIVIGCIIFWSYHLNEMSPIFKNKNKKGE